MTDRIILSGPESDPVTWIEGGRLHTLNVELVMAWPLACERKRLMDEHGRDKWRIRLADARPVYEYKEGEPWARAFEDPDVGSMFPRVECGAEALEGALDYGWVFCLHRRAALVCDTAEQFRAFAEWLRAD